MKNIILITLLIYPLLYNYSQTAEEYYNNGCKRAELGDYIAAIQDYDKSIEINTNYPDGCTGSKHTQSNTLITERSALKTVCQNYIPSLIMNDECDTKERLYYVTKRDLKRFKKQYVEAMVFGDYEYTDADIEHINNLPYEDGLYYEIAFFSNKIILNKCREYVAHFEGDDKIEATYSYILKSTTSDKWGTYVKYSYHYFIKLYSPAKSTLNVVFPSGNTKKLRAK